ncbi:hypothetical protein D9613_010075 [Agrocybe pediades]|uniref:Uncharacterized protein n=1 Tax=Agrocybe pediades TaxID=84607 RepID=A0A8H4QWL1_9AGAR|nr:hypothetical protein D9613_010075 [Agrocybe pediades]
MFQFKSFAAFVTLTLLCRGVTSLPISGLDSNGLRIDNSPDILNNVEDMANKNAGITEDANGIANTPVGQGEGHLHPSYGLPFLAVTPRAIPEEILNAAFGSPFADAQGDALLTRDDLHLIDPTHVQIDNKPEVLDKVEEMNGMHPDGNLVAGTPAANATLHLRPTYGQPFLEVKGQDLAGAEDIIPLTGGSEDSLPLGSLLGGANGAGGLLNIGGA